MINYRRLAHLRPFFRSNHDLISSLKNPVTAVKKERARKVQLQKYDANNDYEGLCIFPKKVPQKTKLNSNSSQQLYLIKSETATKIAQHLIKSIDLNKTFVEINPGPGLLTNLLVQSSMTDLRLFERHKEFSAHLEQTYSQVHPNRVKVKHFDLFASHTSHGMDELSELPSANWTDDINFTAFAASGSTAFVSHLISSIVFQNGILALGRCELYMVIPSFTYLTLTSSNTSALEHYRRISILFQLFFEYRLLDKFPRADFVPYVKNVRTVVGSLEDRQKNSVKGIQFTTVDPDLMYFVKIVPRRDLYDWCPLAQIQELWHFIELHCQFRSKRIIQLLEKTIPGCGVPLILNFATKECKRTQRIYDVDLVDLPPTTNPSMTLSDRDYCENFNIFTQIADLQPSQFLTLFGEFRRLPEYASCGFLPSLESVVLKKNAPSDRSSTRREQINEENSQTDQSEKGK